jgi:hypothetical protein
VISLVWSFILKQFGIGKILAVGAIALSTVSVLGGVYLKGRFDCASKYELAQRDATIADLHKQLIDREDEYAFGMDLFEQFQKVELKNDEIETRLSELPVTGCIDAGWLRGLTGIE